MSFGVSGCCSLITASLIGTGRGITGLATSAVSRGPGVGARPRAGGRIAGGAVTAGFTFVVVSLGGGPALAIGIREESGAITAKLAALSVWLGFTGLSKVTCSLSESNALTSRSLGPTVSCAKITRSVRTLSVRLIVTLSHGSLGSIPRFLLRSTYARTV